MKITAVYVNKSPMTQYSYMLVTDELAWDDNRVNRSILPNYDSMFRVIRLTPNGLLLDGGGCRWEVMDINNLNSWVEIPKKNLPEPVKKASRFILNQYK